LCQYCESAFVHAWIVFFLCCLFATATEIFHELNTSQNIGQRILHLRDSYTKKTMTHLDEWRTVKIGADPMSTVMSDRIIPNQINGNHQNNKSHFEAQNTIPN